MGGGRVHDTRGDSDRFGPQYLKDLLGLDAPNNVLMQHLGHRREENFTGLRRCGSEPPDVPDPCRPKGAKVKKLWIVAPELLSKTMRQLGARCGSLVGHTRPVAQLDDIGVQWIECA